ncbi:hypothetical protein TIFTF001_017796 [Ficus carica]|uniref:Uncharacterized protein n=1 Tax=Ficus carica TaxID=3494 RepID=A0AA88DJ37_FICCA|nr:hypothetical protein TIFTF001_017796 [Ficus carica]
MQHKKEQEKERHTNSIKWVRAARQGGRWQRMGSEGDIGGMSRGGDWRREREGETYERMEGGVAAGIGGEGEKEKRKKE